MNVRYISIRWMLVAACLVALGAPIGCGLLGDRGTEVTTRPDEFVVWGDPTGDDANPLVRDANNLVDRGVFVGTDGRVQFSAGMVCTTCTVERAIISLDGEPIASIRFGPDRDGADVRRPYLVSADRDAYLVQLVSEGESVVFQKTDEPFELVAADLIIWGDPQSDAASAAVRDVDDNLDRFIAVGSDGFVQLFNSDICPDCTVDGASITVADELEMSIRFGPGPNGGTERKPFLVSADGYYVRLTGDDTVTLEETAEPFEDEDDPSDDLATESGTGENPAPGDFPDDDLAVVAGVVENPSVEKATGGLCGEALGTFAPLTALVMVFMHLGRRRWT